MPIKREIGREDQKTTQLYGVQKKLNSNITVQTSWKLNDGKRYTNINQKKVGATLLITCKVDLRAKKIAKDSGTSYNNVRRIYQEGISILNLFTPRNRVQDM